MASTIAIVGMNLGGPDSPDAVEPFLYNLFRDPDVIQLGWARPLQPLLAKLISRRRAPVSREAYAQIGGRSPIVAETRAQVKAVCDVLAQAGVAASPFVAMACWHPFSDEAIRELREQGFSRVIALPLYPQYSLTTTGSSLKALARAVDRSGGGIEIAPVRSYPAAPGFIQAVCENVTSARAAIPAELQPSAPLLFSAHGLPESYIRRGDPYLDEVRITVAAITRRLGGEGGGVRLAFQSRVGRQRWLSPYTEQVLDELADAGTRAVVVCPVAFTGEHVETLQELDIVYRQRAAARGIQHFSRARTVGVHPAFIGALADLCAEAGRARGWA